MNIVLCILSGIIGALIGIFLFAIVAINGDDD